MIKTQGKNMAFHCCSNVCVRLSSVGHSSRTFDIPSGNERMASSWIAQWDPSVQQVYWHDFQAFCPWLWPKASFTLTVDGAHCHGDPVNHLIISSPYPDLLSVLGLWGEKGVPLDRWFPARRSSLGWVIVSRRDLCGYSLGSSALDMANLILYKNHHNIEVSHHY